jgi:hypothetical protein
MQQAMLRRIEAAAAPTASYRPTVILASRRSGVAAVSRWANLAAPLGTILAVLSR